MRNAFPLLLALTAAAPAEAMSCRQALRSAPLGQVRIDAPVRLEAVSSQEALGKLEGGGVLEVRRRVDDFWWRKVRAEVAPSDLQVQLRRIQRQLQHTQEPAQRIEVRLEPTSTRVVCEDRHHRILGGGFTLVARAGAIGLAGLYALEVEVDVTER